MGSTGKASAASVTSKASTPERPAEPPSSERAAELRRPSMMQRMLATEQAHADHRKKSASTTTTTTTTATTATAASSVAEGPTKPLIKPTFSMKGTRLVAPAEPAQAPTEPAAEPPPKIPKQAEQPEGHANTTRPPQAHTVTRISFGSGGADGGVGKAGLATTKQAQVELNSGSRVSLEKPKAPRFECKMPTMRLPRSCSFDMFFGPATGEQA